MKYLGKILFLFFLFNCYKTFGLIENSSIQMQKCSSESMFITEHDILRYIIKNCMEVKEKYGFDPDVQIVLNNLKENISMNNQLFSEEKELLMNICDSLKIKMNKNEDCWHSAKKGGKRDNLEFLLPNKMAAGFMTMLAGSLICIIPGGQGVGFGVVTTGMGLFIDGLASGERPYYQDTKTGQTFTIEEIMGDKKN